MMTDSLIIQVDIFAMTAKKKEVRKGVIAYQYRNGQINIDGKKYLGYSMTGAIKEYRKTFPKRKKR